VKRGSPVAPTRLPRKVAGIALPHTALAIGALEIAQGLLPPAILRHSIRSFLFAALIGERDGTKFNNETLFIASALHDIGLAAKLNSTDNRFEADGANAARSFLLERGVGAVRAERVWDAIALHDVYGLAKHKSPEVRLCSEGVGVDAGGELSALDGGRVKHIVAAFPRHGFEQDFLNTLVPIAKRKPASANRTFLEDVAKKYVPGWNGPPNFCDVLHAAEAEFENLASR